MYISHMRSEGDRLLESVDELIEISRRSGAPAEIYHLKQAGRANWGKLDQVDRAESRRPARRACGSPPTCTPTRPAATGPRGVHAALGAGRRQRSDAGTPAAIRRSSRGSSAEMRQPGKDWENLYLHAGPDGVLLASLAEPSLKPLIGKTVAEARKMRGVTPRAARRSTSRSPTKAGRARSIS